MTMMVIVALQDTVLHLIQHVTAAALSAVQHCTTSAVDPVLPSIVCGLLNSQGGQH